MFIDFGADTTTVSVYKNNILRHLAVIPLGGSNITKDICSQQIEEEDAEELKKKYGNAYADKSEDGDDNPTYSLDGKCSIESHLLEDIVEARINEILANVWNQIVLSGYEDKLLAGAIITGGAANLKNMEEAFSNRTKVEKVRRKDVFRGFICNHKGFRAIRIQRCDWPCTKITDIVLFQIIGLCFKHYDAIAACINRKLYAERNHSFTDAGIFFVFH